MHCTKQIFWLLLFCAFDSFGNSSFSYINSNGFQILIDPDGENKRPKHFEISFSYPFSDPPKIAFLADVHLQDVYADLEIPDFKGVLNPLNGKYATIRTMDAQLNSTRLFNENYFAFHAALEDLVNKGIKYVVMPGDFTDDGQPMNVRTLRKILNDYQDKHGMRFFLTTGNHDPVQPFRVPGGKNDFLGPNGRPKPLASSKDFYKEIMGDQLPVSITEQISHWGYKEIMYELEDHGFFPHKNDVFWTHPFLEFDYDLYELQHTQERSTLDRRVYEVNNSGHFLPDASYLVEPVEGVWLLAIDANVFLPTHHKSEKGIIQYGGNGIGFDQAVLHKKHLLEWIKKIVLEAELRGKTLISFSHYPLVDFHDGSSDMMADLFGENTFQLGRVPKSQTSSQYADAGLQVHFAGHMHINDTGVHKTRNENTLFNIQVPSLAAYPAAYKILTIKPKNFLEIETILLDEVKGMDSFFDLYRMEHKRLLALNSPSIWDLTILNSKNFSEFTRHHLKELVRLRFLPNEWPVEFRDILMGLNGQELFYWALLKNEQDKHLFLVEKKMDAEKIKEFRHRMKEENINWDTQNKWKGVDLINDFYLIKNGDQLALQHIGLQKIHTYQTLLGRVPDLHHKGGFLSNFYRFSQIFLKLLDGEPSDSFSIDLNKGIITDKSQPSLIPAP
jgi:3',5'-cyclic AMP phosphodiesterase CpdA